MQSGWPRIDEEYYELLCFGENLESGFSTESSQSSLLKLMVKAFKAESGQFCLHDSHKTSAEKEKTALVNLSWKFTDQYINYYHNLDPFVWTMPDVGAFRNQDLMPSATWRSCEFFADFIKPQKINNLLVMRLLDSQRMIGHLGLFRHGAAPAFTPKDLYRAQYLSSVFSQKIKQKQFLQKSKEVDLLLKQLKDIPSAGVTVLDSDLKQVYSNLNMLEFGATGPEPTNFSCNTAGRSNLPEEVRSVCYEMARSILVSPQPHQENRHIVLWQSGRQKVDVEILTLPVEPSPGDLNHRFLLLLLFSKVDRSPVSPRVKLTNNLKLTPKECEITEYICQGLTNKEISRHLYISLPTVATHVQHILHKAGISRRSQLINQMLT
jgi:DNA-binding CsgD family transcriptional regulator